MLHGDGARVEEDEEDDEPEPPLLLADPADLDPRAPYRRRKLAGSTCENGSAVSFTFRPERNLQNFKFGLEIIWREKGSLKC